MPHDHDTKSQAPKNKRKKEKRKEKLKEARAIEKQKEQALLAIAQEENHPRHMDALCEFWKRPLNPNQLDPERRATTFSQKQLLDVVDWGIAHPENAHSQTYLRATRRLYKVAYEKKMNADGSSKTTYFRIPAKNAINAQSLSDLAMTLLSIIAKMGAKQRTQHAAIVEEVEILSKLAFDFGNSAALDTLATVYSNNNQEDKAKQYNRQALKTAAQHGKDPQHQLSTYRLLSARLEDTEDNKDEDRKHEDPVFAYTIQLQTLENLTHSQQAYERQQGAYALGMRHLLFFSETPEPLTQEGTAFMALVHTNKINFVPNEATGIQLLEDAIKLGNTEAKVHLGHHYLAQSINQNRGAQLLYEAMYEHYDPNIAHVLRAHYNSHPPQTAEDRKICQQLAAIQMCPPPAGQPLCFMSTHQKKGRTYLVAETPAALLSNHRARVEPTPPPAAAPTIGPPTPEQ